MLAPVPLPFALYQVKGGAAQLREQVEYALLLLRSEVTVPALLTLTQQILKDHWCLPVGEIGKLLQEATSNSGLSSTLKERFGGLKRFIEGYPDIFLVSTDHRFNPLVYLCSCLTEEQSCQIQAGVSLTGGSHNVDNGGSGGNAIGGKSGEKKSGMTARKRNSRRKKRGRKQGDKKKSEGDGGNKLQATAVEFVPGV